MGSQQYHRHLGIEENQRVVVVGGCLLILFFVLITFCDSFCLFCMLRIVTLA